MQLCAHFASYVAVFALSVAIALGCSAELKMVTLGAQIDQLQVSTVCLPDKIAGSVAQWVFRGPLPMHTVADKSLPNIVYFSWTADRIWGQASDGSEGRVYMSKLRLTKGEAPTLVGSRSFDGFVRAGGIDMTEDGWVGFLCAKYWKPWHVHFTKTKREADTGFAPLVLAVCEVKASDLAVRGTPWRIGKQFQTTPWEHWPSDDINTGGWGNYPIWNCLSTGSGYLAYSPDKRMWSAWYGASVGSHTGFAMHTFSVDAAPISADVYEKYQLPVPRDQVESRAEASDGSWSDHARRGTGDHQSGATWRYHPLLKDIGLQKHAHGAVYMQQYGLHTPIGAFAPPGDGTRLTVQGPHPGRADAFDAGDKAIREGGLRACGDGWIMGLESCGENWLDDEGCDQDGRRKVICATMTKAGSIVEWKVIEANTNGAELVRIAPVGSAEDVAFCSDSARFLFGYETKDKRRWLVEVDRHCHMISPKHDVTAHTTWPPKQDWSTTKDGVVVWVTSWLPTSGGAPDNNKPYNAQQRYQNTWDTEGYIYPQLTEGATTQAKVTAYYPQTATCNEGVNSAICTCGVTTCLPNQVCASGTCSLQSCSGSSGYPCQCGAATCLDNQVCDANSGDGTCACTLDINCNGNGASVILQGTSCVCKCKTGFDGSDCSKCAPGFSNYPTCGYAQCSATTADQNPSFYPCDCGGSTCYDGQLCAMASAKCACSSGNHCNGHASSVAWEAAQHKCICTCATGYQQPDCARCADGYRVHGLNCVEAPAGYQWVGINGGYSQDYTDTWGRVWHHTKTKWRADGWGGYTTSKAPGDYTNEWGSPDFFKCHTWPVEFTRTAQGITVDWTKANDYKPLLNHYSTSADGEQAFRVNLQSADAPVRYYTVKWSFCEKTHHGGGIMNFWINSNLVTEGYQTVHHHAHTDVYHWKCIPTKNGAIDVRIQGTGLAPGKDGDRLQSRFSTLEFETSSEACPVCKKDCGEGFCSGAVHYPNTMGSSMGRTSTVKNSPETAQVIEATCHGGDAGSGGPSPPSSPACTPAPVPASGEEEQEELLNHCDCDGCGTESDGRFELDTSINYDGSQANKDACAEKCRNDARCKRSLLWPGGCGLYKTGARSMVAGSSGNFFCYVRAPSCKTSGTDDENCGKALSPAPSPCIPDRMPARNGMPAGIVSGTTSSTRSYFVVYGLWLQLFQ